MLDVSTQLMSNYHQKVGAFPAFGGYGCDRRQEHPGQGKGMAFVGRSFPGHPSRTGRRIACKTASVAAAIQGISPCSSTASSSAWCSVAIAASLTPSRSTVSRSRYSRVRCPMPETAVRRWRKRATRRLIRALSCSLGLVEWRRLAVLSSRSWTADGLPVFRPMRTSLIRLTKCFPRERRIQADRLEHCREG